MLSKQRAFEIAFGRHPSPGELDRLHQLGLADPESDTSQIRSVINCFDRQTLPTPITVRFTERDLETVQCGTFRLVLDRHDLAVSRGIIESRDYEPHLSGFLRRTVRPGMTAVDIGANVGFYTMLLGELVEDQGRVLAFEPNTENCRLLMLSIEANGFKNVNLYPFALSVTTGATCFTSAVGTNGQFRVNSRETLVHPNCLVVPTTRLDQIISEQVDFIKADVEGAEYLAFSGGEGLIRRFRPIITSEFSLEMLQRVSGISGANYLRWMRNLGYRAYTLGRTDTLVEEIGDIDEYLSNWGDFYRIEDIAFFPLESDFLPSWSIPPSGRGPD